MIPCSAATVIGIVCEADVASRLELCSWRRYSALKLPEPQPSSGLSRARSTPPRIRSKRPEVALSSDLESPRSSRSAAAEGEHDHRPRRRPPPAPGTITTLPPQRSQASTARPSSSAAKLDCESVVSSPPHRTASATIVQRQAARALGPQQHARQPDHHQRQEAPVDVRVEEQRVDAEVLLDLVGGDHLRVQQQAARLELPEADRGEHQRQHDERAAAPGQLARRPRQPAQQREEQRERHVEEDDLLERLRAVVGVDRLQRVEHDRRRAAPTPARPSAPRACAGVARREPRHEPGQRARADHDVERHEQVRRAPARLHRHAERQRRQRQRRRARPGRRANRHASAPIAASPTAAAASASAPRSRTRLDLRRVPDLGHQQHRRQHERAEHRPRPPAHRCARAPRRRRARRRAPCPRPARRRRRPPYRSSRRTGSSARRRAGCRRCCA